MKILLLGSMICVCALLSACDVAGQYVTSKAAGERLTACADAAVKGAREHGEDPKLERTMLMGATAYCMSGDGYQCRERPERSDYECWDTEDSSARVLLSVKSAVDGAIQRGK